MRHLWDECGEIMRKTVLALTTLILLTGCQTTEKTQKISSVYQGVAPSERGATDRTELARVRTALAGQYINERRLDDAQKQLEVAFKADSRYAPAYDMMGNLLRLEGGTANLQKADTYFRRAIALDPKFVQARNNYGVYLSEVGRHKEAIEQLTIAGGTLGYTERASALENLGRLYLKLGQTKSAEGAFNKALEIDPNSVVARLELIDITIDQKRTLQSKAYYDGLKALWQASGEPMPARLAYQGIRLSVLQNNPQERQTLSTLLLSQYPLSNEAKKLKTWLNNPVGVPKK